MKYFIILLVEYIDSTASKKGIYEFDSYDECIKNFYAHMGTYVNADNVKCVNVEAKNNMGGIYKNEFWKIAE